MTVGSFALTNCVRGCGFSPVNLNVTVESSAFANCVEGCGSSPFLMWQLGALLSLTVLEVATLHL